MTGSLNIIPWDGKTITEPGVYSNVPMWAYHDDICDGPSISSSGLRKIEAESPGHYYAFCPYNPNPYEQEEKAHFSLGRAAHTLLLGDGTFSEEYAVRPDELRDWRTNKAKAWRKRQWFNNKTVITQDDLKIIAGISKKLKAHQYAPDVLQGDIELSMFWKDLKTGVWLKSRPDSIPSNSEMLADLKIVADASRQAISNTTTKYGYYMQLALAGMGMRHLLGRTPSDYILLFCEKTPPFALNIKFVDEGFINTGLRQIRRAIDTFKDCYDSGVWPDYLDSGEYLYQPEWHIKKLENEVLPGLEACA